MKRLPMKEIRIELDREIKAVLVVVTEARKYGEKKDYDRLIERLHALQYCRYLLNGDMDSVRLYQTRLRKSGFNVADSAHWKSPPEPWETGFGAQFTPRRGPSTI